jgi:hypothetical protein
MGDRTVLLGRSRSVTLFSCLLLGVALTLGSAVWAIGSAAMNLDHDYAPDDLDEAELFAFFFVIMRTPFVAAVTATVGRVVPWFLRRSARRSERE